MNNDKYDINKLLAESGMPSGQDVPILGQQVPVLHGLPVNGGIMTLEDVQALSEDQFRELFMAAIIGMMGAVYMPASKKVNEVDEVDSEPPS